MRGGRYARQSAVLGVGELGQRRIREADVWIEGRGLDAEVCAIYLAGAGVRSIHLDAALASRCRGQNLDVEIVEVGLTAVVEAGAMGVAGPAFSVSLGPMSDAHQPEGARPVDRGARGARWALARMLGEAG